jgi:hypothetical protein
VSNVLEQGSAALRAEWEMEQGAWAATAAAQKAQAEAEAGVDAVMRLAQFDGRISVPHSKHGPSIAAPQTAVSEPKKGTLWKQGQGGVLGRANWQKRDFVLTDTAGARSLAYFVWTTIAGVEQKGSLNFDAKGVDAAASKVERLLNVKKTGSSGSTEWRFAVTCGERTLNMAADTEAEMHEWIDAIAAVLHMKEGAGHDDSGAAEEAAAAAEAAAAEEVAAAEATAKVQRRDSLERMLDTRVDIAALEDQGKHKHMGGQLSQVLVGAAMKLERNMNANNLSHLLSCRPDAQRLASIGVGIAGRPPALRAWLHQTAKLSDKKLQKGAQSRANVPPPD